jgi:hypothetical protein
VPQHGAAWTRRRFLGTLAGSGAVALGLARAVSRSAGAAPTPRPATVAILATEIRRWSHAQHFVDRFLEGYGWEGRHYRPRLKLASLYVDQIPEGDLTGDRVRRHGVPVLPSIAEALTLGGSRLAVDGVLIIAEHGRYPRNEKGQTLYPRYKFFKEVVRVFEHSGRAVPVFNDKHLSTTWPECVEMMRDAQRLGFALLAGSSLPVTWRVPAIDVPRGTRLVESLCACYGGVDSYDFHGLETAQCMSERRAGGESGVRWLHAVRGPRVWDLLAERAETRRLLLEALARSHSYQPPAGYTVAAPSLDQCRRACADPVAYFMEHNDGLRTTMLLLNGLIQDFNYAGLTARGKVIATQMHLPMPGRTATLANFFSPLVHHIEDTIATGKASYPAERTLLTSGMTLMGVESLHRGQIRLETPELAVRYEATPGSTFWRT